MLADLALFLAAAVVAVPLSKRLGLGAVLGYLLAGILIGPSGFGWIADYHRVLDFSSSGVVLMMFVIGLELQLSRLWLLRATVFGLGSAQVLLTTAVLAVAARALGAAWLSAVIVGFGLSMSSTAFVLQMLSERKELTTHHGRDAFGILLFQDLAAIPALALLPFLAMHMDTATTLSPGLLVLRALAGIAAVIVGGRYLLRPLLRVVATIQMPELFTAAALLVVSATALAMQAVALSMSLGAFLAGVLLADSEYRHELQADIEPFKGLLLGLFFIAVGMSADISLLLREPLQVLALVTVLIAVKAGLLFGLGRLRGRSVDSARALGIALSQGGEFAFVLFGVAFDAGLLPDPLHGELIVAVTLSMMTSPLLYALQARLQHGDPPPPFDEIDVPENEVIIAGFGTFGQIIGRMLRVKKVPFTVLEKNWQHVDFVRRFGSRIFYSDAGRIEVLRAAKAENAKYFVLAIANPEESLRVAEVVCRNFPQLRVFACASDRRHAMQLMDFGINDVIRRSYGSSLEMSGALLRVMGASEASIKRDLERFRAHDLDTLRRQHAIYRDEQQLIQTAREMAQELEQLFEADEESDQRTGEALSTEK